MIAALIPTYREGRLLESALRSVGPHVDVVAVWDGPTSGDDHHSHVDPNRRLARDGVWTKAGAWESDAAKRTDMLRWVKALHAKPTARWAGEALWVLWLDADEILVWGEYLRDMTDRAELEGADVGGFPIRLVELDGSVVNCHGKVVRGDRIAAYVESSYQVELENGMVIALPNLPLCMAGGVPAGYGDEPVTIEHMGVRRPPLQGEPHLLHRAALRDPARAVPRQHLHEQTWLQNALEEQGIRGVEER